MSGWTSDELERIGAAEELDLASARRDGMLRRPVTMWVVRHGDDLYVRSVNGRGSSWFRGALTRHEAHIQAGGVEKDVDLVETDDANDEVDTAYRTKYGGRYPSIVQSIVAPEARVATLKLAPRTTKPERLDENVAAVDVELTPDDLYEIDSAASRITPEGARYPESSERMVDR